MACTDPEASEATLDGCDEPSADILMPAETAPPTAGFQAANALVHVTTLHAVSCASARIDGQDVGPVRYAFSGTFIEGVAGTEEAEFTVFLHECFVDGEALLQWLTAKGWACGEAAIKVARDASTVSFAVESQGVAYESLGAAYQGLSPVDYAVSLVQGTAEQPRVLVQEAEINWSSTTQTPVQTEGGALGGPLGNAAWVGRNSQALDGRIVLRSPTIEP